jgi:hypothetical protein
VAKRTDSKVDRKRKLEQLKREQRAKERRKTILTVGIATLVGAVLLVGVIGAAVADKRKQDKAEKKAAAEAKAKIDVAKAELKTIGVATAAASCLPEQADNPIPAGGEHVTVGTKVDYPVAPPSGGKHADQTVSLDQNFFERKSADQLVEQAVHDLEHGVVVAWYDSKLPAGDVEALRKIAANVKTQQRRILVMPWDRSDFPDDHHVVLTAWGHRQACGKVSGAAVETFLTTYENGKDAPEANAAV